MKRPKVEDVDRGWKRIFQAVDALRGGAYAKVGVLADDKRGGLHIEGGKLTVAEIAAVNEFGTQDGKIPSRPAHRMTFDAEREELQKMSRELLLDIIDGETTVEQALGILGAYLAAAVKKRITAGPEVPPPNAPSTARAKEHAGRWNRHGAAQAAGHTIRTLVNTGRTVGAITWAVVMGGKRE